MSNPTISLMAFVGETCSDQNRTSETFNQDCRKYNHRQSVSIDVQPLRGSFHADTSVLT